MYFGQPPQELQQLRRGPLVPLESELRGSRPRLLRGRSRAAPRPPTGRGPGRPAAAGVLLGPGPGRPRRGSGGGPPGYRRACRPGEPRWRLNQGVCAPRRGLHLLPAIWRIPVFLSSSTLRCTKASCGSKRHLLAWLAWLRRASQAPSSERTLHFPRPAPAPLSALGGAPLLVPGGQAGGQHVGRDGGRASAHGQTGAREAGGGWGRGHLPPAARLRAEVCVGVRCVDFETAFF